MRSAPELLGVRDLEHVYAPHFPAELRPVSEQLLPAIARGLCIVQNDVFPPPPPTQIKNHVLDEQNQKAQKVLVKQEDNFYKGKAAIKRQHK